MGPVKDETALTKRDMKFCADCKHYRPETNPLTKEHEPRWAKCAATSLKKINLVTGIETEQAGICDVERHSGVGKCGTRGKLFQARESDASGV